MFEHSIVLKVEGAKPKGKQEGNRKEVKSSGRRQPPRSSSRGHTAFGYEETVLIRDGLKLVKWSKQRTV